MTPPQPIQKLLEPVSTTTGKVCCFAPTLAPILSAQVDQPGHRADARLDVQLSTLLVTILPVFRPWVCFCWVVCWSIWTATAEWAGAVMGTLRTLPDVGADTTNEAVQARTTRAESMAESKGRANPIGVVVGIGRTRESTDGKESETRKQARPISPRTRQAASHACSRHRPKSCTRCAAGKAWRRAKPDWPRAVYV